MTHGPLELGPPSLARRQELRLQPDPSRITVKLFVAGQEDFGPTQSRTSAVIRRVMALSEAEVKASLAAVDRDFAERHTDFDQWLDINAHRALHRVDPKVPLSEDRWRLIGACFTHEFAVEGAALCNPSAVVHPDQDGVPDGSARFVMSVRCIGEGHRSSVGFRTGTIDAYGDVVIDEPLQCLSTGAVSEAVLAKAGFRGLLQEQFNFGENARAVLSNLRDTFTPSDLEEQLNVLLHDRDTFRNVEETMHHFRDLAERSYLVTFPVGTNQSERLLWPHAEAESRGMEDMRLTAFTESDGSPTYFGTYTAFDGVNIAQQGVQTDDFSRFRAFPITGPAANGKGLALFPQRIGNMFTALVRPDFESNHIAFSPTVEYWESSTMLQVPARPWEVIQLGNCGAPIATEAGWLVITHAVGPFRTYYLSAMLLDRDDPQRVIGTLDQPLLSPTTRDRDGYVPNVVYSCGSMVHGDHVMIPFGIADQSIGFATAELGDLLERLTR